MNMLSRILAKFGFSQEPPRVDQEALIEEDPFVKDLRGDIKIFPKRVLEDPDAVTKIEAAIEADNMLRELQALHEPPEVIERRFLQHIGFPKGSRKANQRLKELERDRNYLPEDLIDMRNRYQLLNRGLHALRALIALHSAGTEAQRQKVIQEAFPTFI